MLASVTTIAVWDEDDKWSIILSSCWKCDLSLFALLAKLKETQSGKMSTILEPGLNSGLRGKNEGKTPNSLLFESMRCPLTVFF